MENLTTNWEKNRKDLFEALLKFYSVSPCSCDRCSSDATIRCKQCISQYLCKDCDEVSHRLHPLHDREAFNKGFFKPISPTLSSDGTNLISVSEYA